MIVFRLANKLGFSYTKEHSFGDKSIPPDFTCLHVGFLRIITPIREEAFSKYFRMYIGDDYEWHHKVRKEVKKQSSKLEAYYRERNGDTMKDYQDRNRKLQDEVYALKDDVRALVRAAEVIESHKANSDTNDLPNEKTVQTSNAIANSLTKRFPNSDANTYANTKDNDMANDDANAKAIELSNTEGNESSDKVSLEPAIVVPSDAVNDIPID